MDCDQNELARNAKCFCFDRATWRSVMVYLLCEWAKKKEPTEQIAWTPDTAGGTYRTSPIGPDIPFADLAAFHLVDPNTVVWLQIGASSLTSLTEVDALPNLQYLNCASNLSLGAVDFTGCTSLQRIDIFDCDIDSLDVSPCPNLTFLNCGGNHVPSGMSVLNISGCTQLVTLNCSDNGIAVLNFTGMTHLVTLKADTNALTTLTGFTDTTALQSLSIYDNQLASLNASGKASLLTLDCHGNQLGTLNITGDFAITTLDFSSNPAVVIIGP